MSDGRASKSGEETNVETAMAAVDGPRGVTSSIMRPPGKVYPWNSFRLATDVLKSGYTTNGRRPDSGAGT